MERGQRIISSSASLLSGVLNLSRDSDQSMQEFSSNIIHRMKKPDIKVTAWLCANAFIKSGLFITFQMQLDCNDFMSEAARSCFKNLQSARGMTGPISLL